MTDDEIRQDNKATLITMVTLLAYRDFASIALMLESVAVRNAIAAREVTNTQIVAWANEELADGQTSMFGGAKSEKNYASVAEHEIGKRHK